MLLKKTNIEERLSGLRKKGDAEATLIHDVYEILNRKNNREKEIKERIATQAVSAENPFLFDLLETRKIYHLDQIKKICIDYRLRFLDSRYFKGEIPHEALEEIQKLEDDHKIELKGFKILAPSKMFKLADKDDPLLFAPIGNGYYYLVHKWGNDLHPLRKLFAWPFKNISNLAAVVLLASYILTLLIPEGLFSKSGTSTEFLIVFFFMFKSMAAVVIFYGFALGKNFNPAIWNSKYFNA
ncbi:MAG: hypothetical protein WBM43_09875 [Flavobacteriaceae bacterium]